MRPIVETSDPGVFQPALSDDVNWIPQPAFDKAWSDLTGEPVGHDEWRREVNWNFTGDDLSFT